MHRLLRIVPGSCAGLALLLILTVPLRGQVTDEPPANETAPAAPAPEAPEAPAAPPVAEDAPGGGDTWIDPVTVVATRTKRPISKTPASVTVLDLDGFERSGGADAGDVTATEPSVSIPFVPSGADAFVPYRAGGYSSYRIRGLGGNRSLLTIDGIRQPPEFGLSGGDGRDFFDPAVFETVEILRGSASALHGTDALSGVIAFNTRSLEDALIDAERPWLLSQRLLLREVDDSINHVLNAGLRAAEVYVTLVHAYRSGSEEKNDRGLADPNPLSFESSHSLGKVTYGHGEAHSFRLTAERFRRELEIDVNSSEFGGRLDNFFSRNVYFVFTETERSRERLSLDYTYTDPDSTHGLESVTAKLYYQAAETETFNRQQSSPTAMPPPTTRNWTNDIGFAHDNWGVQVQAQQRFTTGEAVHRLIAGTDISFEHSANRFIRSALEPGAPLGFDPEANTAIRREDLSAFDAGDLRRMDAYLQDEVSWRDWLLIGGLRLSHYRLETEPNPDASERVQSAATQRELDQLSLTPSLALQYALTPEAIVWGRYARGFRNPNLEDATGLFLHSEGFEFAITPNVDLEAESSDAFEVGLKYADAAWQAEVSLFHTAYEGFIDAVFVFPPESGLDIPILTKRNIGSVAIYGAEFSLQYAFGYLHEALEGWSGQLRAAWSEGQNETDDTWLNSVDPFQAVGVLGYDDPLGTWGVALTAIYRARQGKTNDDFAFFVPPSSLVLKLTGYWVINEHLSIDLGIHNLTNRRYWIFPNVGQGIDHEFNEDPELATQPGLHGFAALNLKF